MNIGKKVKEWDLPRPIKVVIPKPEDKPEEQPIKVDNWPVKVPEKVQ